VRTEGLVRGGERSFDGKAVAHAGEPRCVRRVRAWSTHLHATQHASGSLSKKRHGSERACGYSPRGPQLPVAAGAAETAAVAVETAAMAAGVTEAAGAAAAAVLAAAAVVTRAAAVVVVAAAAAVVAAVTAAAEAAVTAAVTAAVMMVVVMVLPP